MQRPTEPYGRLQRLATRVNTLEGNSLDRRSARKFPEPYGKCEIANIVESSTNAILTVANESHILKKFRGRPPSLIVHLHPTHFRFDQQDGSFSYHSEMRLFIEHLQKKTIPHDMLEEFRKSDVQFYDGWLIVRVVDHKSVAAIAGSASTQSVDDHVSFSIHNYNPYITPSPWAPYPAKEQPKPPPQSRSPIPKQEASGGAPGQTNIGSSSTINGDEHSEDPAEVSSKPNKPHPNIFHVALRPTTLSRHTDIVIDSMTPDPKALNRRQSQAFNSTRTPGPSTMPAPSTPLSGLPPTPAVEKGPPVKRQKMKIEPKDLLEYEAKLVNATALPLFLDTVGSLEEAQAVLRLLKDPLHDEEPPSSKGRKRTVAELAAEDALAKEQENFMLIMDERIPGGSSAVNGVTVDGQAAAAIFQPRFEKFNTLESIKAQYEERERNEREKKLHQDRHRRALQQEQEDERKRAAEQLRRRQIIEARQAAQQAVVAAQQQQAMSQVSGVPPGMQTQMMHASQAQRSSPVVRTSTPHGASSPLSSQMKQGHSLPMGISTSNQGGAGSPPRPGSALQHAHPGVAMARTQSNQDPSRHGTPQIPHSTPTLRHGTPAQQMSEASPHGSMMAHTPQMVQAGMINTGQMHGGVPQLMPSQAVQLQAAMRQQQMLQQQQNLARQNMQAMPNGQQYSAEQIAHMQAQHHARQQQALHQQQQQQQQQMQQAGNQVQLNGQASAQQAYQANQMAYAQQLQRTMANQMAQQQQQQQAMQQGSPQPHQTPQQHSIPMSAQQQAMAQQMQNGMPQQAQQRGISNGLPPQMQGAYSTRFTQVFNSLVSQMTQQAGGNPQSIPQQSLEAAKARARQMALKHCQEIMAQMRARSQGQMAGPGQGQNPNAAAMMQLQQQQHQQQQQAQAQAQHYQMQLQQMQAQAQAQAQQQQQGGMMGGMPK